jgi:hypothetical protein
MRHAVRGYNLGDAVADFDQEVEIANTVLALLVQALS